MPVSSRQDNLAARCIDQYVDLRSKAADGPPIDKRLEAIIHLLFER